MLRRCTAVRRSTEPCIPSGIAKSSTISGWDKGGNVTSAGWQVTPCWTYRQRWRAELCLEVRGSYNGNSSVRASFIHSSSSLQSLRFIDDSPAPEPHTHTHTRLTALCPGLPGWAGTRKVKPIWILLKQETMSGSNNNNHPTFWF